MSEKLDRLVPEILKKTRDGILDWRISANPYGREEYFVNIGDYKFFLWQIASGDSRSISLRLSHDSEGPLESMANNWPGATGAAPAQPIVVRFRLYSDLFDAVREHVHGSDEALGKVEELLRKIS